MGPKRGFRCHACEHPERATIDVGLAEHRSVYAMAKHFGISRFSLYRHRKRHLTEAVLAKLVGSSNYAVANLEELRTNEAERLLSNAVEVRRRLYSNAESAERAGDYRAASQSYAFILRSLELIGKLLDQFKGHAKQTVNQLVISPDYIRLRAALIQALQPYPEARQGVARVLRELESIDVHATEQLPMSDPKGRGISQAIVDGFGS